MADLVKKIKIKKQDGTFTDYIPIGAEAQNVDVDGESVAYKLNKKPYYYDSVADMKADTKLKAGDMAITLGYYEPNDCGDGEYIIENNNQAVDDGGSYIELNNHLFAKLIIKERTIKVEQFGAKGGSQNDDTLPLQAAINFGMNNYCSIVFSKNYYVSPQDTTVDDKVCLYIINHSPGDGKWNNNINFYFEGHASIITRYSDECTLIRLCAGQVRFVKMSLAGTFHKTTLINSGRINSLDTEEDIDVRYNYFEKLHLQSAKIGIRLEGATYYNTFHTGLIRDCDYGLIIGFSKAEEAGLIQDSACNRNNFINLSFIGAANGIRITYGDTNKFVNTCFEGGTNGIYLDSPSVHPSDFPIAPKWPSSDNMFVNTTFESITQKKFWNNSHGTKVINTSDAYVAEDWLIAPQVYIGGVDTAYSTEKFGRTYKICEDNVPFANIVPWSTYDDSNSGFGARTYFDYNKSGSTTTPLKRQSFTFEIKEDSNLTGTMPTDGCICKSIGGLVFISAKLSFQPVDKDTAIKLYFPESKSWITNVQAHFGKNPSMMWPIVYSDASSNKQFIVCQWKEEGYLIVYPPTNGWTHTNGAYNSIYIDIYGFRVGSIN